MRRQTWSFCLAAGGPLLASSFYACSTPVIEPANTADAGGADVGPPLPWSRDGEANLPLDDVLRVNHLQALGTHNSYHVESAGNTLPDWHYTLPTLDAQLTLGLRQLELDIHYLPDQDLQVFHILNLDEGTTCHVFRDCLRTIGSGPHSTPIISRSTCKSSQNQASRATMQRPTSPRSKVKFCRCWFASGS